MKYDFINQNAEATETQETERVEIVTKAPNHRLRLLL